MNRITLITGGSRGLGRNTALAIARRGGDIVLTYRNRAEDAEAVVAEIEGMGRRAVALKLDTGDIASFPAFVETFEGKLGETYGRDSFDHLVNNAGHAEFAPLVETTEAQFDALVNVHFKGVLFLTTALLPLLIDGGRIVNISSGLTRVSFPGFGAYSAMKAAVEVLTVYMAREFGHRGITANAIAPGAIETDFGGGVVRDTPDLNKRFADMTALGRVGLPDDIGPMIASFVSDDNGWVNAQRIEVSGGQTI